MAKVIIDMDLSTNGLTISGYESIDLVDGATLIGKNSNFSELPEINIGKNSKVGLYNSTIPSTINWVSNEHNIASGSEMIKWDNLNNLKVQNAYAVMEYIPDLVYRMSSPILGNYTIQITTLVIDDLLKQYQEFYKIRTNFNVGESLHITEINTENTSIDIYFATRNCVIDRTDITLEIHYWDTNGDLVITSSEFDGTFDNDDASIWSDDTLNKYKISIPLVNPRNCICQVEFGCFHNKGTGYGGDEMYVYIDPQIYTTT